MSFTSILGEKDDLAALGGKAGNLAILVRQGLPVPPGFVIESAAFAALGDLAGPLPDGLAEELSGRLAALRPPLIVRSSAVGEDSAAASFAGLLDSIFPVENAEQLEAALRRCWASYFSERCLAYQASGRGRLAGMAVLVQELVPAVFSGVLFTRSPVPRGGDIMLGEYCLGFGEALVAGRIDPGRFTVDRHSLEVNFEVTLEESPAGLAELGRLALRCEETFGGPQDVEWTIDRGGRLFLLQSRPLTVPVPTRRVVWSNANVNENFPAPISPLLYSVAATGYSHYFRNLARGFGISAARLKRLDPAFGQIIGVHGGRMYYHLSNIHFILRGVPGGAFLARSFDDFVGSQGAAAEGPPPTRLWEWFRMAVHVFGKYRNLRRRVAAFEARIRAFCDSYPVAGLDRLSPAEHRAGLRAFLEIRRHGWNDAALADAAAMVCYGLLGRGLRRFFPDDPGLLHDLLKGLPALVSGHPPRDLWRLARLIREDPRARELFESASVEEILAALRDDPRLAEVASAFADYQQRWGFRCSGELMLTRPGLDERPEELVDLLRAYLRSDSRSPEESLAEQRRSRLERTESMMKALPWRHRWLAWLLRATQVAIELRERARLEQARLYNRLRHLALAIGRCWQKDGRLEAADDVFMFTAVEIDELLAGGAMFANHSAALARERRLAHQELGRDTPPDHFVLPEGESWRPGQTPAAAAPPPAAGDAGRIRGIGAGSGRATGPPRYLREIAEANRLAAGDILITRQTDPGWAAIFPLIAGLVLERGGLLSHGAILAREFGIPCVVGIQNAAGLADSARLIQVDGDTGTVDVLA